jgi:hypothetical protein
MAMNAKQPGQDFLIGCGCFGFISWSLKVDYDKAGLHTFIAPDSSAILVAESADRDKINRGDRGWKTLLLPAFNPPA